MEEQEQEQAWALEAVVELGSQEQEQAPEAVVELSSQMLEELQDCQALGESQDCRAIEAEEDPQVKEADVQGQEAPGALEVLLVIKAGEGPQVRMALGVLSQLLSHCFRRLDTMVQVGTGRALLGRQQLE